MTPIEAYGRWHLYPLLAGRLIAKSAAAILSFPSLGGYHGEEMTLKRHERAFW